MTCDVGPFLRNKSHIITTDVTRAVCELPMECGCLKTKPAAISCCSWKTERDLPIKPGSDKEMEPQGNLNLAHHLFFFSGRVRTPSPTHWNFAGVSKPWRVSIILHALPLEHLVCVKAHSLQLGVMVNCFPFDYSLPYFCIPPSSFFLGLQDLRSG